MKLVRDNVPELMRLQGKKPVFHCANDSEFEIYLLKKLVEEAKEAKNSSNIEELADLLEVVYAIARLKGILPIALEKIREKKAIKNGAFSKRIILENPVFQ